MVRALHRQRSRSWMRRGQTSGMKCCFITDAMSKSAPRLTWSGMGYVEYATIIEELSRVDGSVGISVAAHNSLCSNHIYQYGSEEQRKKYLTPLASGEHLGAWGLTEPSAGSDASGTKSLATRAD